MAVRLIPNQLVKLYDTETFNQRNKRLMLDYREYCQIVREEQTTMFQLQILPNSVNLVTNGDFISDLSGWTVNYPTWRWASGKAQGDRTDAGQPSIFQTINVTAGKTYNLTARIQFINTTSKLTVIASQSSSQAWVYEASDYGTVPFDISEFFIADQATVQLFFILSGNLRDMVEIDDVSMYELTEPTVTLERCTGDLVRTIPVFDRTNDYLTYSVDWYGLSEDCYRICIEGIDDTQNNYLDRALALGTEGGAPIELEQGGFLKWFG